MVKKKRFKGKMLVTCCLILSIILGICNTGFSAFAQGNTEESSVSQANEQQEESTETSSDVTEPTEAATIEATQPVTEAAEAITEPTAEITWESTEAASEEATEPTEEITAEATEPTEEASQTEPSAEETTDMEESEEIQETTEPQTDENHPLERISFMSIDEKTLDPVEITLMITDKEQPFTYPAGVITDNLSVLDDIIRENDPTGGDYLTFRRAFVKIPNENSPTGFDENEIARIGTYEGEVYYAYSTDVDAGILLNDNEDIIVECQKRYRMDYVFYGGPEGEIVGKKDFLWPKEGLDITIRPPDYYHITRILIIEEVDGSTKTQTYEPTFDERKEYNLHFEYTEIKSSRYIQIDIEKDDNYTITAGEIQHGGICTDQGVKDKIENPQPTPSVVPGDDVTFMFYSQSWTGLDDGKYIEWYLNMMTINGENVNVPKSYDVGSTSRETVLSDGSTVTITLVKKEVGLYWMDGDLSYEGPNLTVWDKKRCLYEVTVTNVRKDLVISANCKINTNTEMIMVGLEGIESVGSGIVTKDRWSVSNGLKQAYYAVETDEEDNVFPVFYATEDTSDEYTWRPAQLNLYMYSVKPGYNPDTVEIVFYSNGVNYPIKNKFFREVNYSIIHRPEGRLSALGVMPLSELFNSEDGRTANPEYINNNYRIFYYEENGEVHDFYADAVAAGYTHIFGIQGRNGEGETGTNINPTVNASNLPNQVIEITAKPYEYKFRLDLDGGTFVDENYTVQEDGKYIENDFHTVADGPTNANMSMVVPQKEGKIFGGWALVDLDGNYILDEDKKPIIYSTNEVYSIDFDTIQNAYVLPDDDEDEDEEEEGEIEDNSSYFNFVAVWYDITPESEKSEYTIEYYKEVESETPGEETAFELYHKTREIGTTGSSIVVLNYRTPEDDVYSYEIDQENSILKLDTLSPYPENNILKVYYKLSEHDVLITMDVINDGNKTKYFDVEITATYRNGGAVEGTKGDITFNSNGIATLKMKSGDQIRITDLDNGVNYTVSSKAVPSDNHTTSINENGQESMSGVIGDSDVTINIVKSRTITPGTGVELGDNMAVGGFIIAALAGIMLVVFSRRKKNV